jgi:hypothetical protein
MCHVLIVVFIFPVLLFSVDRETGGDRRYPDDPYLYPTEQGKRSPTIPVLNILLI